LPASVSAFPGRFSDLSYRADLAGVAEKFFKYEDRSKLFKKAVEKIEIHEECVELLTS